MPQNPLRHLLLRLAKPLAHRYNKAVGRRAYCVGWRNKEVGDALIVKAKRMKLKISIFVGNLSFLGFLKYRTELSLRKAEKQLSRIRARMAKRRIFSRKKKTARCQVIGRFFMPSWCIVFSLSLFIVSYPQRGILNAPIIKNGFAILQIAICKYHLQ